MNSLSLALYLSLSLPPSLNLSPPSISPSPPSLSLSPALSEHMKVVLDTLAGGRLDVLARRRGGLHLLGVGKLGQHTGLKVLTPLVLLPPVDEHLVLGGEDVWKTSVNSSIHPFNSRVAPITIPVSEFFRYSLKYSIQSVIGEYASLCVDPIPSRY